MDPFHLGDPGREVGEGAKPALAGYREETDNSFALGKLIGSQGVSRRLIKQLRAGCQETGN